MQPPRMLIAAGAVALAAAVIPNVGAQDRHPGMRASAMPPQRLTIVVRPASGMGHDEHVTTPTFAVEPGLPVHVTVTNYTRAYHTFTAPGLGVSALIRPARGSTPTTTVVTFTALRYGVFDWACLVCPDKGSPGGESMHGKIYSIIRV